MKITATQKTISRQLRIMFAFEIAHFFQHFVYSVNIRLVVIIRDFALWRFCPLEILSAWLCWGWCLGWERKNEGKERGGEGGGESHDSLCYSV
jgi:hypothetical protein